MRYLLLTIPLLLISCTDNDLEQAQIETLNNQVYALLDTDLEKSELLADSSLQLARETNLVWEEANKLKVIDQ